MTLQPLTSEASMAKRKGRQTGRIIINVTPEQESAVNEAIARARRVNPDWSKNDVLLVALVAFCDSAGVEFPVYEKRQGERTDLKHTP